LWVDRWIVVDNQDYQDYYPLMVNTNAATHLIRATHTNGYVKCALVRATADVASAVASMTAAGYWLNITVEPFAPKTRRAA
jgi:hypothetical protein